MCVSMAAANFVGTKICLNLTTHPETGEQIHVLLYQNSAVSMAGPNAMLIHLPGYDMGRENFVDMTTCPHVLDDMVKAVTPTTRGGSFGTLSVSKHVDVFDVGTYTVVLAQDARDIPEALHRVPTERRPAIRPDLCQFYNQHFHGWPVALCCFNNNQLQPTEPVMIWYKPRAFENVFRLPAIDCHTGAVPDLSALVDVDHWIFLAKAEMSGGTPVSYRDNLTPTMQHMLPRRVYGKHFGGVMPNGDFSFRQPEAIQGNEPFRTGLG